MSILKAMFKKNDHQNLCYKCTIRLLDETSILEVEFQPQHKGIFLLDFICEQLEILEKDYFGLRYIDTAKQRLWLDLSKSITKQVKDVDPLVLSFRVKFYPADPTRLQLNGKCMLYQQLKRDLRHGRLYCSPGETAALATLIVQEEYGDWREELLHAEEKDEYGMPMNYVSTLKLALKQTADLEKKVMELHRKRPPGGDIVSVYDEFIQIARTLDTYGIDPYPVKDQKGTQLYLGINFSGISTFDKGKRIQHFRWPEISKLNFEGKMFIIHLTYIVDREVKKHTIGFKASSGANCRYIWRCSIEQMLFFTLPNSKNKISKKFRYTGRTEREIMSETSLQSLQLNTNNSTDTSPTKHVAQSCPTSPTSDLLSSDVLRGEPSAGMFVNYQPIDPIYDNGILETVSEEIRRNGSTSYGPGSGPSFNYREQYDQADNFDLLLNSVDGRGLPTTRVASDNQLVTTAINNSTTRNSHTTKTIRKFSLINTFIPCFIFVIIVFFIMLILVLESDLEIFVNFKNLPEMISLKYQYYQVKEFWKEIFSYLGVI